MSGTGNGKHRRPPLSSKVREALERLGGDASNERVREYLREAPHDQAQHKQEVYVSDTLIDAVRLIMRQGA